MILFVDDDRRRMMSFVEQLSSVYQVEFKQDVDTALTFLCDNLDRIDLLILDIMMSPGKIFDPAETEYGLRTGIHFYKKARSLRNNLPIIFFTNFSGTEETKDICANDKQCICCFKEELLPFEFLDKVTTFLLM